MSIPFPWVNDWLHMLAKSKYFSTSDLGSGYWQVSMLPESVESLHSLWVCRDAIWITETVLARLAWDTCMIYPDYILVLGDTLDKHLQNPAQVFDRLRKTGLRLKPTKCYLAQKEITYWNLLCLTNGWQLAHKAACSYLVYIKSGMAFQLARPYHGPNHVVWVVENGEEVRPASCNPTCVALNRVCRCSAEMPDVIRPRKDA